MLELAKATSTVLLSRHVLHQVLNLLDFIRSFRLSISLQKEQNPLKDPNSFSCVIFH